MKKRFLSNPFFGKLYTNFMLDYDETSHILKTTVFLMFLFCYFIPHDGILKKNSLLPKLRTVFNASARDFNKISLNDLLHTGANLLPNISELLLHWMTYRYVFVSDIKQMFRQILIHIDNRKYQQVLCRFITNDEISGYSLNTVTYGVASSPFLANRVMKKLAIDEARNIHLVLQLLVQKLTWMALCQVAIHYLKL